MPTRGKKAKLVLATYYPWYDHNTWSPPCVSCFPLELYNSDDPVVIRRHVTQASQASIDGFASAWQGPANRTDLNFQKLLDASRGTGFRSCIVFETNSPATRTRHDIVQALKHAIQRYGNDPNYLRYDGKPVLLFTDMAAVLKTGGSASVPETVQAWREIRQEVDPEGTSLWIAEGVHLEYLQVFDGLYLINISWAKGNYSHSHYKWSKAIAALNAATRSSKLWIATAMPGWDDSIGLTDPSCPTYRTGDPQPVKVERRHGATYRETFLAAMASDPDWIVITSFNEWVEGHQIEPSACYSDPQLYLMITGELVAEFKGQG